MKLSRDCTIATPEENRLMESIVVAYDRYHDDYIDEFEVGTLAQLFAHDLAAWVAFQRLVRIQPAA